MERAQHSILITAGSGTVQRIQVGSATPGEIAIVRAVLFTVGATGPDQGLGLTHNLLRDATNVTNDLIADEDVWVMAVVTNQGPLSYFFTFPDTGYPLVSPQGFTVTNNSGLNQQHSVRIYYDRGRLPITDWSLLKQRTSFEEGE